MARTSMGCFVLFQTKKQDIYRIKKTPKGVIYRFFAVRMRKALGLLILVSANHVFGTAQFDFHLYTLSWYSKGGLFKFW